MKVLVKLQGKSTALTYEADDTLMVGDSVRLPLPWYLDHSSGRLEHPNGIMGTVVALSSSYSGPCRRILGRT